MVVSLPIFTQQLVESCLSHVEGGSPKNIHNPLMWVAHILMPTGFLNECHFNSWDVYCLKVAHFLFQESHRVLFH